MYYLYYTIVCKLKASSRHQTVTNCNNKVTLHTRTDGNFPFLCSVDKQ